MKAPEVPTSATPEEQKALAEAARKAALAEALKKRQAPQNVSRKGPDLSAAA